MIEPEMRRVMKIIGTGAEADVNTATRFECLEDHNAVAAIGSRSVEKVLRKRRGCARRLSLIIRPRKWLIGVSPIGAVVALVLKLRFWAPSSRQGSSQSVWGRRPQGNADWRSSPFCNTAAGDQGKRQATHRPGVRYSPTAASAPLRVSNGHQLRSSCKAHHERTTPAPCLNAAGPLPQATA